MKTTTDDRLDTVEAALHHLTEAAEQVRSLNDARLDAYVLAHLEGRDGGWLGEFAADHLRDMADAMLTGEGA